MSIEEEEEIEKENVYTQSISFAHTCKHCGHVIAEHRYEFSAGHEWQEYSMECLLCGSSSDRKCVSVMVDEEELPTQ